jgi:hypothetical protein
MSAGPIFGIVLFGDVVRSRERSAASTAWLERLCARLDDAYGERRLAPFEFTQGDEIQGLLGSDADPFLAILDATLRPRRGPDAAARMRWAIAAGRVDPGHGPATRRTGPAFLLARETLERAVKAKDGLRCLSGDPRADELLADTAPVLAAIIDGMTDRQRDIARLALVDGLRQSEIAERLDVAPPTISVSHARGGVRNVKRLANAVRTIWREGITRAVDAMDERP